MCYMGLKGEEHDYMCVRRACNIALHCVIDKSCLIAYACVNWSGRLCEWTDKVAYVKTVTENGVCMLSLSRVNISYMCLNMSRSYWNVCVGRRHENGGELSEGFFLYDTVVHV